MTLYRWDRTRKKFVDKKTGELMAIADENAICKPMIVSDIEDYVSPVCGPDGKHKVVGGRAGQREDLKANGCFLMPPPKDGESRSTRGFRKPETAAANGCRPNEEAQDKAEKRQRLHAKNIPVKPEKHYI